MEHASFDEIEVDAEPSQPSVAVQEGVDGLELVVKERAADENRKRRLLVEEPLEIRHRIGYELGRRCRRLPRMDLDRRSSSATSGSHPASGPRWRGEIDVPGQ